MFQKRKSCMLHHSHHSFNTKSLQCWNLKHQWHYNRTGTWMHRRCSLKFLEHKKDKLEMDMQRECMASDNPEGQKGKKKLLAALHGQICTAGMCFLSVGSRTLLFREARSWFVFLWEQADPLPFKRQSIREVLENAATSTSLLLVLTGCLNKHQHPDMAELPVVN